MIIAQQPFDHFPYVHISPMAVSGFNDPGLARLKQLSSQPHSKQEAQDVYTPHQKFVDKHDGNKRCRAYDKVFEANASRPLDYVESDADDNCLMQYIKRQYCFISISEEPVIPLQVAATQAKYGEEPAPGAEGLDDLSRCEDTATKIGCPVDMYVQKKGDPAGQSGGGDDQPDPTQFLDCYHYPLVGKNEVP